MNYLKAEKKLSSYKGGNCGSRDSEIRDEEYGDTEAETGEAWRAEDELYRQFLMGADCLDDRRLDLLLRYFGSAEEICRADELSLYGCGLLSDPQAHKLWSFISGHDPEAESDRIAGLGIRFVSIANPAYPARLRTIGNPPAGLFYIGRLPSDNAAAVAIVGSRKCSAYGRDMAVSFAAGLAAAGVDVISGMAMGVDGFAHRGALRAGGDTYAVLGTGADVCYPAANRDIYGEMKEKSGIISEYYPGTRSLAANFPRRNRIISGLADGVLVVEAAERSGTWITVDMGLEQGRDIYAVPGRIGDELSFGCNRIIRSGARLVMSPEDIISELAPRYGFLVDRKGRGDPGAGLRRKGRQEADGLGTEEKNILKCLEQQPRSCEEIALISGKSPTEVLAGLTMLELKGLCLRVGTGCYVRSQM